MATIEKRGSTYRITASVGYDVNGKQIRKRMTYKPDKDFTPAQLKRELNKQAMLFEEKCRSGLYMDGNMKLKDYIPIFYKDYCENNVRESTLIGYKAKEKHIMEKLGHLPLEKIQPHHLLEFYDYLRNDAGREDTRYICTISDFRSFANSKGFTQKTLCEKAGVCQASYTACNKQGKVKKATAQKIAAALEIKLDEAFMVDPDWKTSLSDSSILHYHRILSDMFERAVKWQIIKENPCKRIDSPKVKRKEADYLDEKEAAEILNALADVPFKYRMAITLLIYSGMRRGELCGLEWSDIDFDYMTIDINKASLYLTGVGMKESDLKTENSHRVIKMNAYVMDMLKEYKQWQDGEKAKMGDKWEEHNKLFTQLNGKPIHPSTISSWYYSFIRKNGFKESHLHSLRHTNATLLIAGGVNVRTIANRLGHSQVSTTTNIYSHPLRTADERAADALGNILNPARYSEKVSTENNDFKNITLKN